MNDKLNIQRNPQPRMRYEITLTIEDAPGPFETVTGFMQYEVTNKQCAPFDKFIGIYRTPPVQSPAIVFQRIGDKEYKGTVHLDLLQDEDYFGLGVCHWSLMAAIVRLKVGEVTFSPDLVQAQIVAQQSATQYFPKSAYGDNTIKDMSYPGTTLEDIAPRRNEFFAVTLSAKEQFE